MRIPPRTSVLAALAATVLLTAACDSGQSEGSYRDRILGRLPERAMDELREQGPAAIPELIVLTQDPEPEVARVGLNLINMIRPKEAAQEAIPAVLDALKYPNEQIRNTAVQTLKAMRPVSIPFILQGISSSDPKIKEGSLKVAAKGLGKEAAPGIDKLMAVAQSGSDQEKTWAAMALASIGSAAERSIPVLQQAAASVSSENDKKMINGCIKRISDAKKPGMYTDSR
jgi:HEAT repeat protein